MGRFFILFCISIFLTSPAFAAEPSSPTDTPQLVLVVVNKWYECDPIVEVLLNGKIRKDLKLPSPTTADSFHVRNNPTNSPVKPSLPNKPRLVYELNNKRVEVWCISDLLEYLPDDNTVYQSSSERKAEVLVNVVNGRNPSLIVAVGTAASLDKPAFYNGSVVIGASTFVHNGHPNGGNEYSNWQYAGFEKLLPPTISEPDFYTLFSGSPPSDKFVIPPLPLKETVRERIEPTMIADYQGVSLGTVNVSKTSEYNLKDQETLNAFETKYDRSLVASIETTHGIIRAAAPNARFIFISAIVNRAFRYGEEVLPREYAQDFAGVHNAGVVLAWLLPKFLQ